MKLSTYLVILALALGIGCRSEQAGGTAARDTLDAGGTVRGASLDVPPPDPEELRRFEAVMAFARREALHERPVGEIMVAVGREFLGRPYVAGMLDEPEEERLICTLGGFDCVTFVESTLALARTIRQQEYDYDAFARNILDMRYRDGELNGYCSRLHYFSDWIADNEARGNVRNVTRAIGGERLDKTIDFMSRNRKSYPRFATNDSLYQCVRAMEAELADVALYYVPQDSIHTVYDRLQAGDIIATATDIRGLDVTHTGLVYDNGDGTKGFMHASTSQGVTISPDLQRYVQGVKKQIGIIVARPRNR